MQNKSNTALVIVIILVILLAGGYFIMKGPATSGPVTSATSTPVTTPTGFVAYTDAAHGFSVSYPDNSSNRQPNEDSIVLAKNLPFVSGTNLGEKYMTVKVSNATGALCGIATEVGVSTTTHATSNGLSFLKESGRDVGAGQIYDQTAYSVSKGGTCYQIQFILHSSNLGMYDDANRPAQFDLAKESKVFDDIFATFKITGIPAVTSTTSADTGSIKGGLTYKNDTYGFTIQYPKKYATVPGADRFLVSFSYQDPAKSTQDADVLHVSVLKTNGATSFKDYLSKNPILNENSGQPIDFSKFTPVTINGKVFYYIVGERFEGIFATKYYYYTAQNIYLFESHSYIGGAWTDPNFDEANEPVNRDLKAALGTFTVK